MSKLTELLDELCSDGVEYLPLGEVIVLHPGVRITRKNDSGTLYPVYGGGGESFRTDNFNRANDYVISRFAMSENCVRYVPGEFWLLDSGISFETTSTVIKEYVAHNLLQMQPEIFRCSGKSAQRNLRVKDFLTLTIPVPSLEVQREIVRVLDAFTDLEQSLVAELELRTIQMSGYLNDIFENLDAESTTLGSVGRFSRGSSLQKKDFVDSGIPCIHYGQVFTQYGLSTKDTVAFVTPEFAAGKRTMKPGDLFVATTSENDEDLGKAVAWLGHDEVVVGTDAYIYSHDLDPKFTSYFFASSSFQQQKRRFITGTKVRRISDKAMSTFEIKVPAREIQQDIVAQLDAFEALIQSIEQEIALRRKQYEFYRDELLAFEPKEA